MCRTSAILRSNHVAEVERLGVLYRRFIPTSMMSISLSAGFAKDLYLLWTLRPAPCVLNSRFTVLSLIACSAARSLIISPETNCLASSATSTTSLMRGRELFSAAWDTDSRASWARSRTSAP